VSGNKEQAAGFVPLGQAQRLRSFCWVKGGILMPDLTALDQRIKAQLAGSEECRQLHQNHIQQRMRDMEERHQRYTVTADRLMEEVIRPRMERVKSYFDNATAPDDHNRRHTCFVRFAHCPRFPATVNLELGVAGGREAAALVVEYKLEILPVFLPFEGQDQLELPLAGVNEEQVASWVEDKLVNFVATYLRLETAKEYQAENRQTDPVCGMSVNQAHALATMEYRGKTYYFCLEECRRKFAEHPERYCVTTPRALGGGQEAAEVSESARS
jgi:YHS domain-containing protein